MSETIDLTHGEKGEWVEIPLLDMYDHPHPKVSINNKWKFLPGNKYKLTPELATEVKRILKSKEQSDIRLLRPRKDSKAIQAVQANSSTGVLLDT